MTFSYSPNHVQRFSIRAFKFLADHPVVYLHCQVMACHKKTVGSRCSRGCQRFIRKKRDLTEREIEKPQPKESQSYVLGTGGVVLRKEKTKESSGEYRNPLEILHDLIIIIYDDDDDDNDSDNNSNSDNNNNNNCSDNDNDNDSDNGNGSGNDSDNDNDNKNDNGSGNDKIVMVMIMKNVMIMI